MPKNVSYQPVYGNEQVPDITAPQVMQENYPMSTHHDLGQARCQISNAYIVAEKEDAIVLIDQHAAHERIVMEGLKERSLSKDIARQILLVPEIVKISAKQREIFLSYHDQLKTFGFGLDLFGDDALVVREIPSLLSKINLQQFIMDVLDNLTDTGDASAYHEHLHHVLATIACHGSIRAGRALTVPEMNALLRQMESIDKTGQCNHGRPTYIELKLKDVEKLFERT
jgi:DNA mismatch repair protein MutL